MSAIWTQGRAQKRRRSRSCAHASCRSSSPRKSSNFSRALFFTNSASSKAPGGRAANSDKVLTSGSRCPAEIPSGAGSRLARAREEAKMRACCLRLPTQGNRRSARRDERQRSIEVRACHRSSAPLPAAVWQLCRGKLGWIGLPRPGAFPRQLRQRVDVVRLRKSVDGRPSLAGRQARVAAHPLR